MAKHSKSSDNILRTWLQKLHHDKFKNSALLTKVKYELGEHDIVEVIRKIPQPFKNKQVFQNPLPNKYEELRKINNYHYVDSLQRELFWHHITFVNYSSAISTFLSLQNLFEISFLQGEYGKAIQYLNEIEKNVCVSLWGLDNRFLTIEYKDGLEKNKEFLNEINKSQVDVTLYIFADFLSKKAERKLSVFKYNNYFENYFEKYKSDNIYSYFQFKLNGSTSYSPVKPSFILFFENGYSIIDRYLTFKRFLQIELTNNFINISKKYVGRLIEDLNEVIDDPDLKIMKSHFFPESSVIKDDRTETLLIISDKYTEGNYEASYALAKVAFANFNNSLELYELLLKSHINFYKSENAEFPRDANIIYKEILHNMYNILRKNQKTKESYLHLAKLIYSLSSFNISSQLFSFVVTECNLHETINQELSNFQLKSSE